MSGTTEHTLEQSDAAAGAAAISGTRRAIRRQATLAALQAVGRSLFTGLATLVLIVAGWMGALALFGVSPYVAKGPLEVWEFLMLDEDAAAHRDELGAALAVTLQHAWIGFVFGLLAAFLVAVLFRVSQGIQSALMPVALLLRSVPLIAMAPVIILLFGRGTAAVAVIAGIVVLFPALVNIAFGLSSASPMMLDLVHVYGGGIWTTLRKVALPASLPAFFASVRISVPGAIIGALLAEWLATGDGIGYAIQQYYPQAKFVEMWSAVVLVTFVSLILYSLAQLVETLVLSRVGMRAQVA